MSKKNLYLISAAGGNTSAIEIVNKPLTSNDCVNRGKNMLNKYKADQVGFLNINNNYLQMSGGEFCANAARSAAVILYILNKKTKFEFGMSGFKDRIQAKVKKITKFDYDVTCKLPNLKIKIKSLKNFNKKATLVDLGGIVHIIINDVFPKNNYKIIQKNIIQELKLESHKAVGVCWINSLNNKTIINPVVWVRDIDSLFYEKSCGSASIAAAKVTNKNSITQVTGQIINVSYKDNNTYINSKMRIINNIV